MLNLVNLCYKNALKKFAAIVKPILSYYHGLIQIEEMFIQRQSSSAFSRPKYKNLKLKEEGTERLKVLRFRSVTKAVLEMLRVPEL